jgi:glutaredoxin 3
MYWILLIAILILFGVASESYQIKRVISGGKSNLDIVIYSKDNCPWCTKAKAALTDKKLSYKSIDVLSMDPSELEKIMEETGRRTVPNIFINGKNIGGYQELMKWLEQAP